MGLENLNSDELYHLMSFRRGESSAPLKLARGPDTFTTVFMKVDEENMHRTLSEFESTFILCHGHRLTRKITGMRVQYTCPVCHRLRYQFLTGVEG